MGKLTISMAIFNRFLYVYQRVQFHIQWIPTLADLRDRSEHPWDFARSRPPWIFAVGTPWPLAIYRPMGHRWKGCSIYGDIPTGSLTLPWESWESWPKMITYVAIKLWLSIRSILRRVNIPRCTLWASDSLPWTMIINYYTYLGFVPNGAPTGWGPQDSVQWPYKWLNYGLWWM